MSYKLVDLCFHIPSLTTSEQAVLQAICKHADNKTHDCYPSRQVIAGFARLEVRQVQRIIPILVDKGLITRESGKGRKPSSYIVRLDQILRLIGSEDIKTPLQEEGEPDNHSGDIVSPQSDFSVVTLTPSLGRHKDSSEETLAPSCEDIDASLYRKNLSVISQSISQEQSVTLSVASQPHPAVAGVVVSGLSEGIVISPEEAIYQAYPRKEGHAVAIRAIEKAVKKLVDGTTESKRPRMSKREAQKLLSGVVEVYARSPAGQNPERKFIPHPSTWFNGERWDDDQEEWQHTGATNGTSNRMDAILDSTRGAMEILDRRSSLEIINGSKSKYTHSIFDRAFAAI
jgi:hypothetical protein